MKCLANCKYLSVYVKLILVTIHDNIQKVLLHIHDSFKPCVMPGLWQWTFHKQVYDSEPVINRFTVYDREGCASLFEIHSLSNKMLLTFLGLFPPGPEGNDAKQPLYPGFERDVLRTVADYYQRLKEPLLTFHLYEVFVNILSELFTLLPFYTSCSLRPPQRAELISFHVCRPATGAG